MPTIYVKQNDNQVVRYMHCVNADGTYPDLSGATLHFHAGYEGDPASKVIDKVATLNTVLTAEVAVTFVTADLAIVYDELAAEIQATWPNGTVHTFPTKSGGLKMEIVGEVA
jgi:hypothetical protein